MEKLPNVLVYVECDHTGDPSSLSLEALQAAKTVTTAGNGGRVSVLMIGEDLSKSVNALHHHEIDTLYICRDDSLKEYRPKKFLRAFEQAYRLYCPDLTIMGNSKNGLDLAARAAVGLDMPLITDCVDIRWDQKEIAFVKPVYSNNVLAVYGSGGLPCLATVRSKSMPASEPSDLRKVAIIDLPFPDTEAADEYEILERRSLEDSGKTLADADLIVAGGRGMGGSEGFSVLQKLANLLGGQVGSSRPPCDLGWAAPEMQIGITGTIVSPSVYFAVGLSGSFQHIAGMSNSKTVVAVNSDSNATIFRIAHYGVVGEYEPVLMGLIEGMGNRQ
jgi:electron transfer flavoprotein alpha subunit